MEKWEARERWGRVYVQIFERTRLINFCRVIGILAAGSASMLAGSASWAASSTFTPVADTEVREDSPTTNFGRATGLLVDGSPIRTAYLRFDVSIPAGEVVTRATLRLFTTSPSPHGLFVNQVTSTTWGETTTNYSNAPAIGAQVAASGAYPGNAYIAGSFTGFDFPTLGMQRPRVQKRYYYDSAFAAKFDAGSGDRGLEFYCLRFDLRLILVGL